MNLHLPAEWTAFVQEMVASGHYSDENEMVIAGLRLLKSRESLRHDIQAGIDQLEAGETVDGDDVFLHLHTRAQQIVDGAK